MTVTPERGNDSYDSQKLIDYTQEASKNRFFDAIFEKQYQVGFYHYHLTKDSLG